MLIGNLKIKTPVFMAPMAGISDYPYRQLVRKMGVELLYTEMVSAKGYFYGNERTKELIDFKKSNNEKIAVQIFGEEADIMAETAKGIESEYDIDLIDINMGCPARKVVKTGAGSALMKSPELAAKIVKATAEAVDVPVTVKMRSGWDEDNINAVELAKIVENAGAAAVAVHGRTRKQFYRGKADWEIIKKVVKNSKIPVIANGDIFSDRDAAEIIEYSCCDAIMIGRGAQGNPWIFKEIISYLEDGKKVGQPTKAEKIDMALKHLSLAVDYYGENHGLPIMRKHIAWYLKGMPNAGLMKNKVNQTSNLEKLISILKNYQKEL